jgi:hypothetical protein
LIEGLEDRRVMATITGGTGPGGFLLTGATSDFILWTRADALSLNNGDAVASWADQSGRGNDLGTPTGPITYVANGSNSVPAVQFGNPATNANGWLQRPALLSNGESGEVFFMVQTTDANDAQNDGGFYRTGTSSNQHYSWGDNFAYENFGTNTRVDQINVLGAAGGTYNPTNHNIYNVSGVSAGAWAIRLNGETRASKTSNGASTFHAQWYFGKSESPEEWQGQISEIVMLNRALNPAERIIVQNYLHSKYGVIGALTDDRYAGDTPANGNFDREVFGIGRFDASN